MKFESFSIIFINLERFKDINNSIGHMIGDQLLIEIAKRILSTMNENYVLSRFSGDEFVLLCKDINNRDLDDYLQELIQLFKTPFKIGNNILHIYINIGVSVFPNDASDAETLVRYANIAMSRAKLLNEEKICFYSKKMSQDIESKFHLNNCLVDAISNNEFSINYQPIFDISSGGIKGAEALIRWSNPTLGKISPGIFIPLAEQTGQIIAIGEWVLEQVCQQINIWESKGYNISPISVNLSVKQLEQDEFSKTVIRILDSYKVSPKNIELEITESVSSGDITKITKNLKDFKNHGIKIAMDDFGTGFSSLGQLDLFELDKLKIDKMFIDDLVYLGRKQNLVKSIIAMADSLELTVVAEGIETKEQLDYLKDMGCQLGQGFICSKPMIAEEFEKLLE